MDLVTSVFEYLWLIPIIVSANWETLLLSAIMLIGGVELMIVLFRRLIGKHGPITSERRSVASLMFDRVVNRRPFGDLLFVRHMSAIGGIVFGLISLIVLLAVNAFFVSPALIKLL